ncbi:restriction endonuclease subunit S [Halochromatium salexigens]|uniref:Type I restriction modification DNA specificity domain-containing protein n=1 Tax=Halochromatium salexigens TaxID=49447 RepID=A0AAJ0UED4_HALSE|nr:restriction endonuclease subunit S [Halochromatium salexigens]MBK5929905.1 hypothetical protein [Halochromatium salexigens]
MTGKLRPYPEYKETDLPWLGRVPVHWDIRRNGRLFSQRNETGFGDLPILEVSLKTGVRVRDMDNLKRKQIMSDREKYKRAARGDIAYNMMRMWQGAVGVVPEDGLVSPAYVVARAHTETEPRYFNYLFRTDAFKNEIDGYSRGIVKDRNRLYWEDFKRIPACFPPPEEQAAIANYLDAISSKINRFIRNRRRLIEVLNEQKQAIINRAVTRGLDPDVPLKPSGIEWLGEIPGHWEVCRLRHIIKSVTSGSRGWSDYAADDGPLFIRIGNLRRFSLDLRFDDVVRLNLPDTTEALRTRVWPNDLLISITAYIGSIAVIPANFEKAYISQHVARCSLLDDTHNARWLGYVLLSNIGQMHGKLSLYGGTKDGLSLDDVKNYPVLLPPRSEQNELVTSIEHGLKAIILVIEKAEREITLIREYRTRLIADVVTGQVDVRHLAPSAPLPANDALDEDLEADALLDDEDADSDPALEDEADAE